MRPKSIVLKIVAIVVIMSGLLGWHFHRQRVLADQRAAQESVFRMIVAVRNNDMEALSRVLWRYTVDGHVLGKQPAHTRRIAAACSRRYGLSALTDGEIRASFHIVDDVPFQLKSSILKAAILPSETEMQAEFDRGGIRSYVVGYNLGKHRLVSLCIADKGKWYPTGLPALSRNVLKYETIYDAFKAQDAVAE